MNLSSIREILVLHHSHTDIGFTHPPVMVWDLHRRFIDEAIELCEATAHLPEPSRVRWTCETTAPLLYWLERASERQIRRFRELVRHGQLGAGAMCLNLTPLANAETLVRGLEPLALLRRELGLPLTVAINHDVNGLPWPITDLLLDAGVDMLLMGINIHFGSFPLQRPRGFNWQTPAGRSLLALNADHYQSFDREARVQANSIAVMAEGLSNYIDRLQANGYPYDFVYLSATHHGFPDNNPPNPRTAALIRRWNDEGREPRIRYILPEELAQRLRRQPDATLPHHSGDWTDYWNFGSGSSAVDTKVCRHARQRLSAAETLRALGSGPGAKTPASMWSEAWRNVVHFEEHTWCSSAALRTIPAEPVNEQWHEKAITAYAANSLASILFRDALEQLAGPAASGENACGIMLCNPSPVARTGYVRVPLDVATGKWEFFSSNVLLLEVRRQLDTPVDHGTPNSFSAPNATLLAGPFTLPPFGFGYVSRRNLSVAVVPDGVQAGDDFIESPFFRMTFDRQTGRIAQLHDKRLRRDLIDITSPWSFFGYVQETPDGTKHPDGHPEGGREAFFDTNWERLNLGQSCWNFQWAAQRRTTSRLIELRTEVTAAGASLILRWKAPGVDDFLQKITLETCQPRVTCTASFNKSDIRTAEGTYFTFPLAMHDWRAHFDTAGVPVEFEREQLPGTCTDWVTVDSWAAVHDQHGAVTLACPDAPLVQIGGFRFARGNQPANRSTPPLLIAWPMNNYWNTNFRASQPGYAQFRYVLTSQTAFDPAESLRTALQAASEIEWQPVSHAPKQSRGRLALVSGTGIVVLGATVRGRAVVLRLLNVRAKPCTAKVRLPNRNLVRARQIDATGRKIGPLAVRENALCVSVPARSILLAVVELSSRPRVRE